MIFNKHLNLSGSHAFLGASKYHWINYDEDTLAERYRNHLASIRGTELHELAEKCIRMHRLQRDDGDTFNMYVNDAIGFNMNTEQVLYYSDYVFGTVDAICCRYEEHDGKRIETLRIHDLKTGSIPAHMEQLLIYAALFCLEYKRNPSELYIELRIYQNDEIVVYKPPVDDIIPIMDRIVTFDKKLKQIEKEEARLY